MSGSTVGGPKGPRGGGIGGAAAAAAEAARRAAEEARRRAEEARRRAEEARRAAEAARKAQEAADRRAREAAEKRAPPAKVVATRKEATQTRDVAADAQKTVDTTKLQARKAEVAANAAARKADLPLPFPRNRGNKVSNRFDVRRTYGSRLGIARGAQDPALLSADVAVSKIRAQPAGAAWLDSQKIGDGRGLLDRGASFASPGALSYLTGSLSGAPAVTQALILGQLTTLSPELRALAKSDRTLTDGLEGKGVGSKESRSSGDPDSPPTEAEVAAMPAEEKEALEAIGVEPLDLVGTGEAAMELVLAGRAAVAGDWEGTAEHLAAANEAAPELAQKALAQLAQRVPEPAAALLGDPKTAGELLRTGATAVQALLEGDLLGAVAAVSANESLRNTVIDAAAKNPTFQATLEQVGLTPEDLKAAGAALPGFIGGVKAALAGDWPTALQAFSVAAQAGSALAQEVVLHLAGKLPEDHPARAFLTNPTVVRELLLAGPEILSALWDKQPDRAFELLAKNPTLQAAFVDAVLSHPKTAAALDKLGLSADDVRQAGAAAPELLAAAMAAKDGEWTVALGHLANAAKLPGAGELAAKLIAQAASNLPVDHPARVLLTDQELMREVLLAGGEIIDLLLAEDLDGALGAIAELSDNPGLVQALKNNPYIQEQLERLGLSEAEFDQALGALPHLLRAASALGAEPADVEGAIRHLADAAAQAPGLGAELIGRAAQKLPPGPARDLLGDPELVAQILTDAPELLAVLRADGAEALAQLGALTDKPELQAALLANPTVSKALADLGITDPAMQQEALAALPHLLEAAAALASGDPEDVLAALGHVLDAADAAPGLVAKVVGQLAARLDPDSAAYALLTDETLVKEALAAGGDVLRLLAEGKLEEALAEVAGLVDNPALVDAFLANRWVASKLDALGLTVDQAREAIAALPALVEAGRLVQAGDWPAALAKLGAVAQSSPALMATIGAKLAERIPPGTPVNDALRALLKDGTFLTQALGDEELHQAIAALLDGGDLREGLGALLGNPTVAGLAAPVLYAAFGEQLLQLGIGSAEELQTILGAAPDLLAAVDAAANNELGLALDHLKAALDKVGPELLGDVLTALADRLPVPEGMEGLREVIKAAVGVLTQPGGLEAVKNLLGALTPPDAERFGDAVAELGGVLSAMRGTEQGRAQIETLLNALGVGLPGNFGALFRDPALNHAMVQSGALDKVFEAGRELVKGNVTDAVKLLGEAALSLLQHPESEWLADGKIPLTTEGLKNFARLFKGLYEALPNAIKNRIQAAVSAATGNLLGNIPFIGDAIDAGKDLVDFISAMKDGELEDKLMSAGHLAIDAAKFTQVGKVFTGPLETALTVLQAIDDAVDAVNDMREEFQSIMLIGGDTTEAIELKDDERRLIAEITAYGVPADQALQVAQDLPGIRPTGMTDLVTLARALGIPPERFDEFVAQLNGSYGKEDGGRELQAWIDNEMRGSDGPLINGERNGGTTGFVQTMFQQNYPEAWEWAQQAAGPQAMDDAMIVHAFRSLYGRDPLESELAQWRDEAAALRADKNPLDMYFGIRDGIRNSEEYRESHPA